MCEQLQAVSSTLWSCGLCPNLTKGFRRVKWKVVNWSVWQSDQNPPPPKKDQVQRAPHLHNCASISRKFPLLPTHINSRGNYISFARLERIYTLKNHRHTLRACHILPTGFSDHCAVVCNVSVKAFKHRSAYWCLNTSLLENQHFKDTFAFFWDTFRKLFTGLVGLWQGPNSDILSALHL